MMDGPALAHLLGLLPSPPLRAASVKLTDDNISGGRVLCTLPRAAFAPQSSRHFIQIAEAFTGVSCTPLLPVLPHCALFHFGIDPQDGSANHELVRKVYAELTSPSASDPELNYLALKVSGGRGLLTHYLNHAVPDRAAALALLAPIDLPLALRPAAEAFMIDLADQTTAPDVLDVVEHGSHRRSIDINFSDHPLTARGLTLLHDLLIALRPSDIRLADLLRPVLSHVAIGTSATGQAFVTLYGFPQTRDSERPAHA